MKTNVIIYQRHLSDNVRIVLDLLEYYDKKIEKQISLIFLDFETVFDNVDWTSLIKVLEEMNSGQNLTKWIKSIFCYKLRRWY